MRTHLPIPNGFNPYKHDAGHLHQWLVSQGITLEGVSIIRDDHEGEERFSVVVESENDPTDAVASFTPEHDPYEASMTELASIDPETASDEELRRSVALMQTLLVQREEANAR